jgi:ubiquinone biosynthesis accessory factor UbiJ
MPLESPFAAALNRLLGSESWARERLAPFAGETLELRASPLPSLRFSIREDGRLDPAMPDAAAALTVTFGPGALAAAVQGEEHLLRAVEVSGNARLATEVMFLVRHLRWDAEEDAARLIGDVAAHRLAGLIRGAAAWHAEAARRVAESLVEYATEEARVLVTRAELAELARDHARLRDGLERLDKRVDRLGRGDR